jgi:cytoskeletal protein CcmA (bactofilin family)
MFPKKTSAPVRSTIDAMAAPSFSVFGVDTTIRGDVSATADLHVDGRIEGDIACTGLVQGESSEIHGAITAQNARLAGTIHGTISVGQLVILKSAQIHGDVQYDTLTIEQGARVEGRFSQRGHEAAAIGKDGEARLMLAN